MTTHDVAEPNSIELPRRLTLPNLEVARLFRRELVDRAQDAAGSRHALASLHATLTSGDVETLAYELENALLNSVSYHDLQSENSCHMWLLSLLYGMDGYRFPRSNRENGRGRPDVLCEPDNAHDAELPAIVCEAKFVKDASIEALRIAAEEALDTQALPKRYDHGLAGAGTLLYSAAFNNHKQVSVVGRVMPAER